jgi:hypothetical protein
MNHSLKCDNCGEPADDECPTETWGEQKLGGCGWELCMKCRQKVLEQEKPCCPNCGNHNWPPFQRKIPEIPETQEAAAKGLQQETEETIQKNNDSNPV